MSIAERNQANAQHSTGPITEEGRATSSRNATTHGLTAKNVLLPYEDPAEYQALSDGIFKDLAPQNTIQSEMVQELIDVQWRLRRVPSLEARILSSDSPDFKALNNIGIHAARLKRQFSTTLAEFRDLKAAQQREFEERMEKASLIYQLEVKENRESSLPELGFDFTEDQIQLYLGEKYILAEARKTAPERKVDQLAALLGVPSLEI